MNAHTIALSRILLIIFLALLLPMLDLDDESFLLSLLSYVSFISLPSYVRNVGRPCKMEADAHSLAAKSLNDLFQQWLALPETEHYLNQVIAKIHRGPDGSIIIPELPPPTAEPIDSSTSPPTSPVQADIHLIPGTDGASHSPRGSSSTVSRTSDTVVPATEEVSSSPTSRGAQAKTHPVSQSGSSPTVSSPTSPEAPSSVSTLSILTTPSPAPTLPEADLRADTPVPPQGLIPTTSSPVHPSGLPSAPPSTTKRRIQDGIGFQLMPPLPSLKQVALANAFSEAELSHRIAVVQAAWTAHALRQRLTSEGTTQEEASQQKQRDADEAALRALEPGSMPIDDVGLPLDGLLPITTEVFQLSAYANRVLYHKLLGFQRIWGTDIRRLKLRAAYRIEKAKRQAAAASPGGLPYDAEAHLAELKESLEALPPLIFPRTIVRIYMDIFRMLDPAGRLFFVLLGTPPAIRNSSISMSSDALRQYFLANDLVGYYSTCEDSDDYAKVELLAREEKEQKERYTLPLNDPKRSIYRRDFVDDDDILGYPNKGGKTPYVYSDDDPNDPEHDGTLRPPEEPFSPHWLHTTFLRRSDVRPLVQEVVNSHPGLEFLSSSPDFQGRYAQTVVARIFYTVNVKGDDRITLAELRKSNLLAKLGDLSREEDINQVYSYFSYEHFYVIYCRFWELDTDHDMQLEIKDLMRYEDKALTEKILERVFNQIPRKFRSGVPGKMGYDDFVVFLISEVDKTSPVALDYWFRCIDTDADGVISAFEMEYFFEEQKRRLQAAGSELLSFADVVCQLTDMIHPTSGTPLFTRADLRRSKMAPLFFDILFNMSRYVTSEARDVNRVRLIHATQNQSDWDRWASQSYFVLAGSEGEDDDMVTETSTTNGSANAGVGGMVHGGAHSGGVGVAGPVGYEGGGQLRDDVPMSDGFNDAEGDEGGFEEHSMTRMGETVNGGNGVMGGVGGSGGHVASGVVSGGGGGVAGRRSTSEALPMTGEEDDLFLGPERQDDADDDESMGMGSRRRISHDHASFGDEDGDDLSSMRRGGPLHAPDDNGMR